MQMNGSEHPTTLLLSMHKAGSTFLAGNFAFACQQLFPGLNVIRYAERILEGALPHDMPLPATGMLVSRLYPESFDELIENPEPAAGRFSDKRLIMMIRDPRDVAVSLYYSYAFSHPIPPANANEFLALRQEMKELGLVESIRKHTAQMAIGEFTRCMTFLEEFPHTLNAPYELLVTDFQKWFAAVARYLGWNPAIVTHVGPALAADVKPPPLVDQNQHKRRVKPGNWREVFDEQLNDFFDDRVGDLMRNAGYAIETVQPAAV